MTTNGHDPLDDELSAAARSLHREWHSPELWPSIAGRLTSLRQGYGGPPKLQRRRKAVPASPRRWYGWAAAAALILAVPSATWIAWRTVQQTTSPAETAARQDQRDRLLTDEALAEVERAETRYTRAIDEAIEEARMQIDMNPFNAELRRQLMFIYQEKRQTLEQVQAHDENTL